MRWLFVLLTGCGFHGPSTATSTGDDDAIIDAALPGDGAIDAPVVQMIDAPIIESLDAAVQLPPFGMTGSRWLLPCTAGTDHTPNATACKCTLFSQQVTIGGVAGTKWHVMARIRGVMEKIGYVSGMAGPDGWYIGGAPVNGGDNIYQMTVDQPSQHYYINTGTNNGNHSYAFDYMAMFDVAAGANITFAANGQDGIQWMGVDQNGAALSVPGVTDPVQPYDGQWARIDVVSATAF